MLLLVEVVENQFAHLGFVLFLGGDGFVTIPPGIVCGGQEF